MPNVNGTNYSYTKSGMAAANKARNVNRTKPVKKPKKGGYDK